MTVDRDKIFKDIDVEREYQNGKWGTAFDLKNTPNDWVSYIVNYTGKAVTLPFNGVAYRSGLLKVAALAVAALEYYDQGVVVKRHYD